MGDKIELLRFLGIRGAIEMGDFEWYLDEQESKSKGGRAQLLNAVAEKIGEEPLCLENLLKTIKWDPHAAFIRMLWIEANPTYPEDSISKN